MNGSYKVVIALILVLLAAVIYAGFGIVQLKRENKSLSSAIEEKNAEIKYRTNERGKLIAEKQVAEIRAKDLEQAYPKLAESIIKDFDIKLKNLRAYMQAEFAAHGQGQSSITNNYYTDSTGVQKSYWQLKAADGYLDFQADVYDSLHAPYKYVYSDTMKYAFNLHGKWYERKKLYGSGMLSNKNAKITNSTSILINDYKDKRFGIGPYVGMDYRLQPSFGISVHYSIVKF
jgi:hypothetical protein